MIRKLFNAYLDEAAEAIGVTQLGRALAGLASAFGYSTCVIADGTKLEGSMSKALLFTTGLRSELAEFADRHDYSSHATFVEALASDRPFIISEVRARREIEMQEWLASLPPKLRQGETLVLPVHRANELVLIVACNGLEPDTTPMARAVLHTAANASYDRFKALAGTPQSAAATLTGREAECLRWMSLGKTGVEIAKITGISPRTVRYHLKNVKKKLGVDSTLGALVKLSSNARPTKDSNN